MSGLVTNTSFTLIRDLQNVPVAAYDSVNNLIGVEKWIKSSGGVWMLEPADENGYPYINAQIQGSNAIYCDQAPVNTTAAVIGTQACSEVLVQAAKNNTVNVLIGNSANQYIELTPGQSITIPCVNVNQIYARTASSTATINYLARS